MGGGKLQVVALLGIGDAAACEEGAPYEGRTAALVLQHAEVDMVGEGAADLRAEGVEDQRKLFGVGDGKALLAACPFGRELVEADGKGAFEKLRQALGKVGACGDDAHFPCVKAVAVQQHAVALGHGGVAALQTVPAELALGIG